MTTDPKEMTDTRREISRRVVALLKEYVGRGPTSARTLISGDLVLVVLADTLTKGERVLAGEDEVALVREMRRTFLRTMQERLRAVVEEETGRSVRALLGDHSVLPDYAFTACLLEPEESEREGASSNGDAPLSTPSRKDVTAQERDQQRQISRGMVSLYKEYIGRGPTDARTYIEGDVVASLLGDTLTKAEQTLADEEKPASVTELRRQFQSALKRRACEIVSEATGSEIVAFMSDHSIYPDYAVEVFVLANGDRAGAEAETVAEGSEPADADEAAADVG